MPSESPPPPTKANLKSWWSTFTSAQKMKKEEEATKLRNTAAGRDVGAVFGQPLKESLKYASVQISTAGANGELYVWGYIPVVVAKCGLYLKECATEVEGTFRVNGSNKRMRELQAEFEAAPRYGKSLDWKKENYTTHDVASVFRRYLTMMPEPVIPYNMYHDFRTALGKGPLKEEEVVTNFRELIKKMPRANQYLLLYVLDLLSVFARKSDKNLMTSSNLAVIFRPGLISHPDHEMSPREHDLSQKVLEFLIHQQDWFILDIPPPDRIVGATSPPPSNASVKEVDVLVQSQRQVSRKGSKEGGGGSDSGAESSTSISEGWKLIGMQTKRMTRRRTNDSAEKLPAETSDLTPVSETPEVDAATGGATGVGRSRTLPSVKSGKGILAEDKASKRVLRKQQKRAASNQSNKSDTLPGP